MARGAMGVVVSASASTGTRRVVFKNTDRAARSSVGGVGTPVVVSTGPTVGGVGIGASVLWVLSVVASLVTVVSTVVVEDSVVGGSVSTLVIAVVVSTGAAVVSSVVVVLASVVVVVVTVEASVLPPGLKKSSLQASRGASFGSWAQSSHT